jgi:AraC-like DNA-binding protein
MVSRAEITAWRPAVPGVNEVLHARFTDHAYPMHTHDSWTLLIVDDGAVRYDLDRHEHGALSTVVTLLPPGVPHNGAAATAEGFRKRVLYLASAQLDTELIGRAVDRPEFTDPRLRLAVDRLHTTLLRPGEELAAESGLALICAQLRQRLRCDQSPAPPRDAVLAGRLRELLDARYTVGLSLQEASAVLYSHPAHLVRVFSREYGLSPHQYLTGRRVDLARRLLLSGMPTSEVITRTGFYDQSHLSRHFRRILGISPGRFARTGRSMRISSAR